MPKESKLKVISSNNTKNGLQNLSKSNLYAHNSKEIYKNFTTKSHKMLKTLAIAALLALAHGLRMTEDHETIVYDKNGNMAYEINTGPKKTGFEGPGSVALVDCNGKNEGDECKLGGMCMRCGGVMQCRYWRRC